MIFFLIIDLIIILKVQMKSIFSGKGVSNLLIQYDKGSDKYCDLEGNFFEGGGKVAAPPPQPSMMACLFPTHKADAPFKEAKSLRNFLLMLIFLEICYICLEIFLYGSITMALFEIPRCWLCYFSYMTLGKCGIYFYMVWVVVGAGLSVFYVLQIKLSLVSLICFPCQLLLMAYTGYLLWFKLIEYNQGQARYAQELKNGPPKSDAATADTSTPN